MGLDAGDLLGAEQLAGVRVNNRGYYLATLGGQGGKSVGAFAGGAATGAGGVIGSSLMAKWARRKAQTDAAQLPASTTPAFTDMAFLAVTPHELTLIDVEARTTAKLATVLARVPRAQVRSVVVGSAGPMASKPLTVTFVDGSVWLLEVSAALKRGATKVVAALSR